jgi:hypothetical protein
MGLIEKLVTSARPAALGSVFLFGAFAGLLALVAGLTALYRIL